MPKRKPQTGLPAVHKDLQGYSIDIDAFGEIRSSFGIDRINDFLNKSLSVAPTPPPPPPAKKGRKTADTTTPLATHQQQQHDDNTP